MTFREFTQSITLVGISFFAGVAVIYEVFMAIDRMMIGGFS